MVVVSSKLQNSDKALSIVPGTCWVAQCILAHFNITISNHSSPSDSSSTPTVTLIFLNYISDNVTLLIKIFLYTHISYNKLCIRFFISQTKVHMLGLVFRSLPDVVRTSLSPPLHLPEYWIPAMRNDLASFELKMSLNFASFHVPLRKALPSSCGRPQPASKCCFCPCALQVVAQVNQAADPSFHWGFWKWNFTSSSCPFLF